MQTTANRPISGPNERTSRRFADCYCHRHGIHRDAFVWSVFRRTLYPHARVGFSLIAEFFPRHFNPDLEFITDLGQLRDYADCDSQVWEFAAHPENRAFGRRWLRLRVSTQRVRRVLREVFVRTSFVLPEEESTGSVSPFVARQAGSQTAPPLDTGRRDSRCA